MSSDDFRIDENCHDTVALGGDDHETANANLFFGSSDSSTHQSTEILDNSLQVEIPESKSEQDKVHFLIHTQADLEGFKPVSKVWRQHEEFIWLHDNLCENEKYMGLIIPPAPPKPEFESSRNKLRKLGNLENSLTEEELQRMKDDLHEEYVASFKKTVAMHETFLKRLVKHPKIRKDTNFIIFLEYPDKLSVRTQNTKEKATQLFKNLAKNIDENVVLANKIDNSPFFRDEKPRLFSYYQAVSDAAHSSDQVIKHRVSATQSMLQSQIAWGNLANPISSLTNRNEVELNMIEKFATFFEKAQRFETKLANDEDWKLTDTLKYYQRETDAAKYVLYTRSRLLTEYETSNKNLEKARERRKNLPVAEAVNKLSFEKFDNISKLAEDEIKTYKIDRVKYFDSQLHDLAKLQIENTENYAQFLKNTLEEISKIEYHPENKHSDVRNGRQDDPNHNLNVVLA